MPFGSVTLLPGINIERTPTSLQAGISTGQNIRFRDALVQKIGGFDKFYPFNVAGIPRDMHAWQDLNSTTHLLVGSTGALGIITGGISYVDITPQIFITFASPNYTATTGTAIITVVDNGGLGIPSTDDAVLIRSPVSIGGIVLSGLYPIRSVIASAVYTIQAATAALSSAANSGTLPVFQTLTASILVTTTFTSHGLATNDVFTFMATTTFAGISIYGSFPVVVIDVNHFTFDLTTQAFSSATQTMSAGNVVNNFYISYGPPSLGSGYGSGGYGSGGYGSGVVQTTQTGTPITAFDQLDWTSDNWGQIILICPEQQSVYSYDPSGGFLTASIVETAPLFNNGIFVSSSKQQLFCWGSTVKSKIGEYLDPMLIRYSNISDFTNFTTSTENLAGSFRIPIGSEIRGGMAVQNQNMFWTDLDLWVSNFAGFPLVWGFNKIGSGAGLISSHAAQQFRDGVYWMGPSNFYKYDGSGLAVLPCPMWDFVYQNLNTAFVHNIRAMPNTPYNEIGWLFPSAASVSGENDSYIKMNVTGPGSPWDGGPIARSAWIDQTVLGNPIGASPTGTIYQHETSNDADGNPINASFTTGYFYISEGEDFAFVDKIIPDFIWGLYGHQADGAAQIQMTFNVTDYPGDTPRSYGPYTVVATTEYIPVRFRGRQMSITVSSNDVGSFWRLGKVRYRYAPSGRR